MNSLVSVSPPPQPEIPETLLGGRYQLIEQLGAGGFGQTFIAQDVHLPGHPHCVLKRLQPQITDPEGLQTAKRLFDAEAQALYQLGSHDQIPRLLAHFEHEQEFYLAQELVVGQTLSKELIAGQPWTEAQVVVLLQDLLGILRFVHQQGVIHRDIKPANLMRRHSDQRLVLIDFGAVKQVSTQLTSMRSGATQTIAIGTPGYMPNEQLAGTPRFSSDVYAVGMVGIHALTGLSPKLLPDDSDTGETLWRQEAPQVSDGLAAVLDTMIRYDFRARYAQAAEALAAIEQWAIAAGMPSPSSTSPIQASTLRWEVKSAANKSDSIHPHPSQMGTEPVLNPHQPSGSPIPLILLKTVWQSTLAQLKRLKPRKQLLPLTGLVLVGGLIAFINSLPYPQPRGQSPSGSNVSRTASPSPSPSSSPSPSPDPTAQAATLLTQANQLRERKQFAQALNVYEKAIALNAKSPDAHWGRCYSLNTQKKFTAAIAACDAALKLDPNYAEALWSKGYALDLQGQDQAALVLYERATTLKPNFAEAWNNKGTALLQLNRPAEALVALDQAIRRKSDFAEAWNSRGAALWSLQRFDEAIASVDQALQIQPNYQPALGLSKQMRQRAGRP
ncbi:MAG: tetratricopeptide repeat protein [Leptolyngbyaceae cyanobacterium SU_3_3]|nr:tetratricopeptide repeat protein [Leptolyngbyaceae cyanobacterium SU_3_3]